MSSKFHEVEVVTVTPELAAKWLTLNADNYRNPKTSRIRRYAREMEKGNWRNTGDPIRFDEDGHLVDGQHRLYSQVESGTTQTYVVVRGLTPEEVDALDQGASRTASDVLRRHGVEKYRTGVASTLRLLKTWDSGQVIHAGSATVVQTSQSEVLELLDEYPDVEKHQAWAYGIRKELGFTPAAAAAARYILDRVAEPEEVQAFWDGVEGVGVNGDTDPRRTLMRWVRKRSDGSSGRVNNSQQLYAIFAAWNAWREGRTLKSISLTKSAEKRDEDGVVVQKAVYREVPDPR